MAALEAHIVVELRKSRQAVQPPMGVQGIQNKRSRSHLRGPGRNGRSPKGPRGKDLEQPKTFHPQVFDHIKGIYLGQLLRRGGQIPARRRCGTTNPLLVVEQTVAPENASDRTHTGHHWEMRPAQEHLVNGLRPNEAQRALGRELPTQRADISFQDGLSLVCDSSRSVRASVPIHAPQRPIGSSIQPPLDGAQSYPKAPRRLSL